MILTGKSFSNGLKACAQGLVTLAPLLSGPLFERTGIALGFSDSQVRFNCPYMIIP